MVTPEQVEEGVEVAGTRGVLQLNLDDVRECVKQYRAELSHLLTFAPMIIETLVNEVEKLRAENERWRAALADEHHFAASKERDRAPEPDQGAQPQ